MAKYRIEELSFIDNILVQPGTEIESDATPGTHWTPLDKKAEKASADAAEVEAQRQADAKATAERLQMAQAIIDKAANTGGVPVIPDPAAGGASDLT